MRLAIVKLSALGDIIHASFLPQIIKKHKRDMQIDWFVEERFADILENHPYIDNIIKLNLKDKKNIFNEFKNIKKYKNRYDKTIDLQGLIKSSIVSKSLGNGCGFDKNSSREGFSSLFYKEKYHIPYHENVIYRNYLLTCKCLGINIDKNELFLKDKSLFYHPSSVKKIKPLIKKDKKNIIIVVGSSWESKVYPKEKFLNIVQKMDENFILTWGNEKEKNDAIFIEKYSNAKIAPKLSLDELKALIDHSDLTIGGDSGPTHIAWALNKPSVTIFGPTPSERNTLKTDINLSVDCKKKIDPKRLNKEDMCIKDIDESEIIALAKRLLNG